MTTRRGLLLSTALGWVVGQLGPGPKPITGNRIGASHARGHLLRDGPIPASTGAHERADVVIVGAGVAGLSAAWRLASHGLSIVMLELEPAIGGTSTWGSDGVVEHPWGAHYLPAPNQEARATVRLLESMGVIVGWDAAGRPLFDSRVLCHAPEERLFYRGAWHSGLVPRDALEPGELAELTRFSDMVEAFTDRRGNDGRYFFQIPVNESSRDPEALALDTMSMSAWLAREGFTTDFVKWHVRYATLDDFGGDPDDVSAWAGIHYFAARKLRTEQLAGSHYLVWPEGNGRLVKALRAGSEADVRTNAMALAVEGNEQGATVRYWDATNETARTIACRAAVVAAPAFIGRRLAPGVAFPERKSSPWLVANLHIRRPLEPDHPWDSVIYGAEGLGYADAAHQTTPPREDTVLTYFRAYGDADTAATRRMLVDRPWPDFAADVLADLAPAHPDLRSRTSRMDIVVWGHAMPRPCPGFLGARPFTPLVRIQPRVLWAHVDQPGIALFEEAQRSGVLAAETLLADLGLPAGESWL
ncbi:MAG: FAD-dependent oxidoreductase [Myxococcales bacterium]|nr:FAD-dependent oxidoreductase [Myxococcales bacterium]